MKNKKVYLGDSHKAKRKWEKKKEVEDSKKNKGKTEKNAAIFWDEEYRAGGDKFSLSTEPSEDLMKFTRWLARLYKGQSVIDKNFKFVDCGCGNGRNSLYLSKTFGAQGIGYDISQIAINEANKKKSTMQLQNVSFTVQDLKHAIPAEDSSADLVIDAVASHVLKNDERVIFKKEVVRVLSTGSYYFLKSLLLDDDDHAKQMIRDYGTDEKNSYIHPTMGIFEHVPTEQELIEFYKDDFEIEKIERSHAHKINGRAFKRRYIVLYLRKK